MREGTVAVVVHYSRHGGQRAIRSGVPDRGSTGRRDDALTSYALPEQLLHHHTSSSSRGRGGIAVFKVNKNGKLQDRRLSFTPDRRALLVTTQKLRSWRGRFWQRNGGSSLLSANSSGKDDASLASGYQQQEAAANGGGDCRVIPLLHVDRLQLGFRHTVRFLKAADQIETVLKNNNNGGGGGGAFSIVYELYDEFNRVVRLESLDLVVPHHNDYQNLVGALQTFVSLVPEQVRKTVLDVQYLRYQWTLLSRSVHKPFEAPLNAGEWLVLADHMGLRLPKQKLQQLFQHQVGKQQQRGFKGDLIEWTKIAYLVQKAYRMQGTDADDPISNIWKDLIENDPVPIVTLDDSASFDSYELNVQNAEESISPSAFQGFLRDQQGERDWSLDQVVELIHALNTQVMASDESYEMLDGKTSSPFPHLDPTGTIAAGDRLCYERFRHYLLSGSNDLLQPAQPHDMSHPLSHYYICSSHDTYLAAATADSWETTGSPRHAERSPRRRSSETGLHAPPTTMDAQNYLQALIRGVRCLEMTVWDGPNGRYPVLDRTASASGPPLDTVWETIRYFCLEYDPQTFPILVRIENHCSAPVQKVLADQIKNALGDLVFKPRFSLDSTRFTLSSPKEARGKVVFMAKRPRSMKDADKKSKHDSAYFVMHDDYDDENDVWDYVRTPAEVKSFDELNQTKSGPVVSFDTDGPIYATTPDALTRTPTELLEQADLALSQAQRQTSEAKMRSVQYEQALVNTKRDVENMAMRAGMTYDHIVKEVAETNGGGSVHQDEKSPKDEGVEIHEVLLSVPRGQGALMKMEEYVTEAEQIVQLRQSALKEAEQEWKSAKQKSEKILSKEDAILSEARKARSEATARQEHARAAADRFRKVQNMVQQNSETSSSAETVVVTAMTEAKISEKRASESEARASRASATAAKDRARAETESNKEEELEQEVNEAAERCARAGDNLQAARAEIEKLSSQKKRVEDQIRLIEQSSQYKKEISERSIVSHSNARHGGAFMEKQSSKMQELASIESKANQLMERINKLEGEQRRLQKDFEEYNHLWKVQVDISSKVRKVADRSAHIAEELAEHAEEEREAANLRLTAHQRAEATAQKRGSQTESLDTQLNQAKRAMDEANKLATQSRKKADELEARADKLTEGKKLRRALDEKEQNLNKAKAALDEAVREKRVREEDLRHENRRYQITDEVAKVVKDDEATRGNKMQAASVYHRKAVKMYGDSLHLKADSEEAVRQFKRAQANVDTKAQIARRAREYKITMDRVNEIPPSLANLTLLHTQKHAHWEKSVNLSNAYVHSIAHHVLQRMVETQPDSQIKNIHDFTADHLCRVFPSWKDLQQKSGFNYDPVFPFRLGCQIVPMNYHSSDENLLVSEGFFRQNGSCGYVLKSPHLLGDRAVEETERWRISVLAGYNLPLPKKSTGRLHALKPVVKISVHVGDAGSAPYAFETGHGKSSGPNPMYMKEVCEVVVTEPSTAMVAFTVWDKQDGPGRAFVAGAAVPVSRLRQGYRTIMLFDSNHARTGPHAYAALFVHAEKER